MLHIVDSSSNDAINDDYVCRTSGSTWSSRCSLCLLAAFIDFSPLLEESTQRSGIIMYLDLSIFQNKD